MMLVVTVGHDAKGLLAFVRPAVKTGAHAAPHATQQLEGESEG